MKRITSENSLLLPSCSQLLLFPSCFPFCSHLPALYFLQVISIVLEHFLDVILDAQIKIDRIKIDQSSGVKMMRLTSLYIPL